MSRLVLLLEEYSMRALLEKLLPRLFPELEFLCVSHEGKNDLQKSIPRKLRAFREPGIQFCIVHDQDRADCKELKQRLMALCDEGGRSDAVVRIACRELEAWYFGDIEAVAAAYERPDLQTITRRAKYREPDAIDYPARELERLVEGFQKVSGARLMGKQLTRENHSQSYQRLIAGIEGLIEGKRTTAGEA